MRTFFVYSGYDRSTQLSVFDSATKAVAAARRLAEKNRDRAFTVRDVLGGLRAEARWSDAGQKVVVSETPTG